jgi:Iap family predicted aminopeptidase
MSIDATLVVRELSDVIGCRVAGSQEEKAAAAYLARLVEGEGWDCDVSNFEYRGWRPETCARLDLGTADRPLTLEGMALPYTLPTDKDGATGALVGGGVATIIEDRIVCQRFYIEAADGSRIGRVLVEPYDDLRPIPNPRATDSLPTIILAGQHMPAMQSAVENGTPVRLSTGQGELIARGRNVVARTGPRGKPELLLVAHYDSVIGSPGANDNASGVAVALLVMEHATRAGHPVRLLLSAAEELMFRGAEAYLAQLQDEDRVREVAACLCLDMLGVGDELKLRAPAGGCWYQAGLDLRGKSFLHHELPSSDHWVFHQAGLPSAQLTRQPDPHYHSPRDTSGRIRAETLLESAGVANGLIDLVVPRLNKKNTRRTGHGEG